MKRTTVRQAAKRGRPEIPEASISNIIRAIKQEPAPNGKRWTVRAVAERFGISTGKAAGILKTVVKREKPKPAEYPVLEMESGNGAKVNMADIAREAGVSKQTVSRALRGAPRVSAETQDKILRIAARQGYRPNPLTAALMADIRRRKPARCGTVIMMLHDLEMEPEQYDPQGNLTPMVYYQAARKRAEELGYRVDTLRYNAPGMTGERLESILQARGICGLYIVGRTPFPDVDWKRYSVVCGRDPFVPSYCVLADVEFNIALALRRIQELNYSRIGLVLDPAYPAAARHFGAFHAYRYTHRDLRLLAPFDCGGVDTDSRFKQWFKREKPDVVLTSWTGSRFCQLLEKHVRSADEPVALVSLGIPHDRPDLTGVELRQNVMAESAINLLHEQMVNNRFGLLPANARVLLIRGVWHDGGSG